MIRINKSVILLVIFLVGINWLLTVIGIPTYITFPLFFLIGLHLGKIQATVENIANHLKHYN